LLLVLVFIFHILPDFGLGQEKLVKRRVFGVEQLARPRGVET